MRTRSVDPIYLDNVIVIPMSVDDDQIEIIAAVQREARREYERWRMYRILNFGVFMRDIMGFDGFAVCAGDPVSA